MTIDLRGLSAKELGTLISKAKEQQDQLAKRAPIASVRSKLARLAEAEGYTIAELFGTAAPAKNGASPGRKLGKVPPKYRNPANPDETWSGRGKLPRWLAALIAKGRKPEDFLIKKN